MAIKLMFDRGPLGRRINTHKRVRLVLGYCSAETPHLFKDLRKQAEQMDKFLKIDFVQFVKDEDGDMKTHFKSASKSNLLKVD